MKRLAPIVIAIILFTSAISAAETYKIANAAWAGWSPSNVAYAKGFWKDEGVDVRLFTLTNPQELINLFKKRLVHISFEMIGTAADLYMEGLPVRIIAETNWSHGGDKIILRQNLDSSELKDRFAGVYIKNPPILYFFHQFLTDAGLKLADLRVVEMEPKVLSNRFIDGALDAILCFNPWAMQAVRQGKGRVVATSADYKGCMPEGMMALEETLEKIPEADLQSILRGWIRAVEWCKDPANWEEYMEILNTRTFKNDPPYSEADLKAMLAAVKIHDREALVERNRVPGGLSAYVENLERFLSENGMLKKAIDTKTFLHTCPLLDALQPLQKP